MVLNIFKKSIRAILFIAVLSGVLFLLTKLLMPTWMTWNNDNTMKEFYQEPENSLQVIFLGTSQVASGVSPIELYDRYGICSYDLGTERQPLLASYYWLQEAERLHPGTLKVVVLDVSYLFFKEKPNNNLKFMSEKALAHMKLSPVKIDALRELSERYDDFDYLENLVPLLRYHSRWNELTRDDFKALTGEVNLLYTRGQQVSFVQGASSLTADQILLPHWDLTDEYESLEEDEQAFLKEYGEDNLMMIDKIHEFCLAHNLRLVLTKIPKYWTDLRHDAAADLAKKYDVPFIDYNDVAVAEDVGLYFPTDYMDAGHPNIRGAKKLTDYIGRFLKEHYALDDVRNDPFYDYMKEQSEQFKNMNEDSKVNSVTDLAYYLKTIQNDRYTIFITTAGDASSGMTDEVRSLMEDLGLSAFSSLRYEQSYMALISGGSVLFEELSDSRKSRILADGCIDHDTLYVSDVYNETLDVDGYVIGTDDGSDPKLLSGPGYFSMKSETSLAGGETSVIINNTEYSDNRHGLNFVIYDNVTRMVIDSATFDLRYQNERRSDYDPIEAYNERYQKAQERYEEEQARKTEEDL